MKWLYGCFTCKVKPFLWLNYGPDTFLHVWPVYLVLCSAVWNLFERLIGVLAIAKATENAVSMDYVENKSTHILLDFSFSQTEINKLSQAFKKHIPFPVSFICHGRLDCVLQQSSIQCYAACSRWLKASWLRCDLSVPGPAEKPHLECTVSWTQLDTISKMGQMSKVVNCVQTEITCERPQGRG